MNLQVTKRVKLLNFFSLAIWLMTSLGAAWISLLWGGVDFRGYYAAAKVLLTGGNLYEYHQVAAVLLQVTGEMGNNPYYYPPWFAWLFIPFAQLPFQLARFIWMFFNLVVWNISLFQLSKFIDWPVSGWKRYTVFTLSTLTFAWITFRYEQAGILVLGMFVAFLFAANSEKWTQAGIWMALLLVKPNITSIVVGGICLWLVRQRQWRPILVMIATLLTLLAVSTLLTPDWFKPFLDSRFGSGLTVTLDGPEKIVDIRILTTLRDWLVYLGLPPTPSIIIYAVVILIAIASFVAVILHSQSVLEATSLCLLISCAITPYILQYDYPPLAITYFWAFALLKPGKAVKWIRAVLAGFIFYASMWDASIASRYWMIIGLTVLVASTLYFKNQVRIDTQAARSVSQT